jgi:hypothetical protein
MKLTEMSKSPTAGCAEVTFPAGRARAERVALPQKVAAPSWASVTFCRATDWMYSIWSRVKKVPPDERGRSALPTRLDPA